MDILQLLNGMHRSTNIRTSVIIDKINNINFKWMTLMQGKLAEFNE